MNQIDVKNIDGAIFDLDGTLLDSMHIWSDIGIRYLLEKGITPEEDFTEEFRKMSLKQAAEYYREHYNATETVDEISDGVNKMVESFYFNEVLPKAGILDFLSYLKSRNVKMCVATATDKYLVEKALERNKMLIFFSEIFTCTTVGAGKDTPVIYEKSLLHLGTDKSRTYVFEDAFYAMKTAKNAGFKVVGIKDMSETAAKRDIINCCDIFIDGYENFQKIFVDK